MRPLAAVLLALIAAPVSAADINEDRAKGAAVAFLKAVKSKEKFDELKEPDQVPTELAAIHTFAEIKDKIKSDDQRKATEDVVGKDGFVAVVAADGKMIPILVRIKDDKAIVVGLGR